MASFCRGRRMKIGLITYCLFFVSQSKISTARERLAFNVTISFTTSVKHALAHRCSLNFYKGKALSNKVNIRSLQNIQQRRGRHRFDLRKETKQTKKRLILMYKQRVCSFRRIQKRIFDPRFARFLGRKEREIRNWICNNNLFL